MTTDPTLFPTSTFPTSTDGPTDALDPSLPADELSSLDSTEPLTASLGESTSIDLFEPAPQGSTFPEEFLLARGGTPESLIRGELQVHGARYDESFLRFERLELSDKLELARRVSQGRVSFGTFANALDTLQRYKKYDNQEMLAFLGEALYSDALDPFTPGSDAFSRNDLRDLTTIRTGRSQRDSGRTFQNGVSRSDAQLALDTILLTAVTSRDRSTGASRPPVLVVDPPADYPNSLISWPSGEFGFDHVLAGAMGDPNGVPDFLAGQAIDQIAGRVGGPRVQLTGNDANTWVGDLVAVVAESGVRDILNNGRVGTVDVARVYRNEFPPEDQISDILGAPFVVDPDRHNLGQALTDHLEPFGDAFQNKYTRYADSVGLLYDGNGSITNREQFIADWSPTISAMAFGFAGGRGAVQALLTPDVIFDGGSAAQTARFQEALEFGQGQAEVVLDRWLDYVEQGLTREAR